VGRTPTVCGWNDSNTKASSWCSFLRSPLETFRFFSKAHHTVHLPRENIASRGSVNYSCSDGFVGVYEILGSTLALLEARIHFSRALSRIFWGTSVTVSMFIPSVLCLRSLKMIRILFCCFSPVLGRSLAPRHIAPKTSVPPASALRFEKVFCHSLTILFLRQMVFCR